MSLIVLSAGLIAVVLNLLLPEEDDDDEDDIQPANVIDVEAQNVKELEAEK